MQVNERSAMQVQRGLREGAEKPREPGQAHQGADAALAPSIPGDDAAHDQDTADHEVRSGQRRTQRGVVRDPFGQNSEADPEHQEREPTRSRAHQPATAAARASPESSFFGMKRQPEFAANRHRSDATLRLEVSTTVDGTPSSASRSATSKPSMSGSCTSIRTISGRSSAAAATAAAP